MAVVLRGAVRLYYYLNDDIADTRTQDWFLMRTPWPGLSILGLYLMAVFKWLPDYMSQRQPFELRVPMAIYNFVQVIGCSYLVYQSLVMGWLRHYKFVCQPVDYGPHAMEYAWKVCYGYFAIKMIDLIDTIIFVLRKKQNQVTFLHVYHHFGMVAVAWGIVKWLPGGHTTILVPVNSFVHVIMYGYYLLSVWDDSYKRSLWWKKHVTQIQINVDTLPVVPWEFRIIPSYSFAALRAWKFYAVGWLRTNPHWARVVEYCLYPSHLQGMQFMFMLIHFALLVAARDCEYPKTPAYIMIPQDLFIVTLFLDFYYRAYIRKPNQNTSQCNKEI